MLVQSSKTQKVIGAKASPPPTTSIASDALQTYIPTNSKMSDTVLSTHVLAITRHTGEIQSNPTNYLTQSHLRQLESTLRKTVRFYNILNLILAIVTIASVFVLIYIPGVNDDLRKGLMIVLIVCYPLFAMYFPWMPVVNTCTAFANVNRV